MGSDDRHPQGSVRLAQRRKPLSSGGLVVGVIEWLGRLDQLVPGRVAEFHDEAVVREIAAVASVPGEGRDFVVLTHAGDLGVGQPGGDVLAREHAAHRVDVASAAEPDQAIGVRQGPGVVLAACHQTVEDDFVAQSDLVESVLGRVVEVPQDRHDGELVVFAKRTALF